MESDIKVAPEAPPNLILIYVDEDPQDVENLDQIHIANVVVSDGKLELIVVEEHEELGRLRTAITGIRSKETLPLTIERMKEMEGEQVLVLGKRQVSPEEPEYIYGVHEEINRYGFSGEVR